jgi:hypothetical protein
MLVRERKQVLIRGWACTSCSPISKASEGRGRPQRRVRQPTPCEVSTDVSVSTSGLSQSSIHAATPPPTCVEARERRELTQPWIGIPSRQLVAENVRRTSRQLMLVDTPTESRWGESPDGVFGCSYALAIVSDPRVARPRGAHWSPRGTTPRGANPVLAPPQSSAPGTSMALSNENALASRKLRSNAGRRRLGERPVARNCGLSTRAGLRSAGVSRPTPSRLAPTPAGVGVGRH